MIDLAEGHYHLKRPKDLFTALSPITALSPRLASAFWLSAILHALFMTAASAASGVESDRVTFLLAGVDAYADKVHDLTAEGTYTRWTCARNGFENTEKLSFRVTLAEGGVLAHTEVLEDPMLGEAGETLDLYAKDVSWVDGERKTYHPRLGTGETATVDRSRLDAALTGLCNPLFHSSMIGMEAFSFWNRESFPDMEWHAQLIEESPEVGVVEVRVAEAGFEARLRIWVNTAKGFAIERSESWAANARDKPTEHVSNELKEVALGIWLPSATERNSYRVLNSGEYEPMERSRVDFTSVEVNKGTTKNDLPITFPGGTSVADGDTGAVYTVLTEAELDRLAADTTEIIRFDGSQEIGLTRDGTVVIPNNSTVVPEHFAQEQAVTAPHGSRGKSVLRALVLAGLAGILALTIYAVYVRGRGRKS